MILVLDNFPKMSDIDDMKNKSDAPKFAKTTSIIPPIEFHGKSTWQDIDELFKAKGLYCGRMISGNKTSPKGCKCVWNANVISPSRGKIWYGDLNITKEGKHLKSIAEKMDEILYVLRELDCRFDHENDPIPLLISKAVWNTSLDIITN